MIRLFKYLFLAVLIIPNVIQPMWISSVGGPLNPVYANAPITQICNAARAGNLDVVKSLIKRVDLEQLDPCSGITVLMNAAQGGYLEIVKILLDAGANPNGEDAGGWSPLRSVIHDGDQKVIQMLIDHGADINYKDFDGQTLLMLAAIKKNVESVQTLIDARADLYSTCKEGKSALVYASEQSHLPTCIAIVDGMFQPVQEQKNRFYTFLNCLRQQCPGFGVVGLRKDLLKPLLHDMIRAPEVKVLGKILEVPNTEIKKQLLERYWPIKF